MTIFGHFKKAAAATGWIFQCMTSFHILHLLEIYFLPNKYFIVTSSGKIKIIIFVKHHFWEFLKLGWPFWPFRGLFELKLGKCVNFVMFSIYADFGEVLEKLKKSTLVILTVLLTNFNPPRITGKYDNHEMHSGQSADQILRIHPLPPRRP